MEYKLLSSEIVYHGHAFTIRVDKVRLPDGRNSQLDIVEHIGSVIIIPIDADDNLLFVRQYRHAAKLELLEFPAGTLELNELPEVCARREIREETGKAAEKMQHLGGFYLAPGYSTEYMEVYLATDLSNDPLEADADEFLSVESLKLDKVTSLCENGKILDAKTLAAFSLLRPYLKLP
jgi:ADP-ribose pyrophosphatase